MATIWMPLPDEDFDVTEVAVPWRLLTRAGHRVVFSTENGKAPAADPLLLRDGWFYGPLGAAEEPRAFYREMLASPELAAPTPWRDIDPTRFEGLLLSGGHAPKMKQYLESELLHDKVAAFWKLDRPVGAICHGVIVLARAKDESGASVLATAKTTCLPKYMERSVYFLTAWRLGKHYRTYPAYVEDEVRAQLKDPATQFVRGPKVMTKRGSDSDDTHALVVEDGRYVSARWPGDAYLYAKKFMERL